MRKLDTIAALCRIVTTVGREMFKDRLAHDCFCHESMNGDFSVVESDIISFIDRAVAEKIERETAGAQREAYSNATVAAYRAELDKTRAKLELVTRARDYWHRSSDFWRGELDAIAPFIDKSE